MHTDPLNETATLVASVAATDPRRAVVAALVDTLEADAGVATGDGQAREGFEPLVVLQRRFGRAHHALGTPSPSVTERVMMLSAALRDPETSLLDAWAANRDLYVLDAPRGGEPRTLAGPC